MPKPKDAKQQACAPSSLILACYFAPVRQALGAFLTPREIRNTKILLTFLIVPSIIGWGALCVLGLLVFGHAFFRDFISLGFSLLAVIGLVSLTISAISIFKYPHVSKLTVLTFILGLIALIIGGFIGFFSSTYILSLASLIWAGGILIAQFYKQRT